MKNGSINFIPLLIIVALIYVFFTYDLESLMKNERLNDNIAYIKDKVTGILDKYTSDAQNKFFKTEGVNNTNKTNIFNLNNFLPQINNLPNEKSGILNDEYNTGQKTKSNMYNQRPAGYEDYGALR